MNTSTPPTRIFSEIQSIGVIWVIDEATKLGFQNGNLDWSNLGQGEPEIGQLEGGTSRVETFFIEPDDNRYGATNGIYALRKTIADYYNRLYRTHKTSKYTAENVSIAMGARLALTRLFTILSKIRLGYKVPEYPAYEDMLNYQLDNITPVCVPTSQKNNHSIPAKEFAEAIAKYNLDAFLFSNPCNPTGHVIKEKELQRYVELATEKNCTLLIDEVYSHYIYPNGQPANSPVSAAQFIDNVNSERVVIVDGLTKSFRYPGWRMAWVLASTDIIERLGRAASAIDGGASVPMQKAAIQLFERKKVAQEMAALQTVFSRKQQLMLAALRNMGMICSDDASSTFYIWADISQLPPPLNDATLFFKEALKKKVITVPGYMFDIHPAQKEKLSDFNQHIRFSFGPTEDNMLMGLERIADMVASYQL